MDENAKALLAAQRITHTLAIEAPRAHEAPARVAAFIRNQLTAIRLSVDSLQSLPGPDAASQREADYLANEREEAAAPALAAIDMLAKLADHLDPPNS